MAKSPWSVKGIDPETREAAKMAARRAGMPVGAWLSQVIRQAAVNQFKGVPVAPPPPMPGYDDGAVHAPAPPSGPASVPALTMQTLFENLQRLVGRIERIEESDGRAAPTVAPIERAVMRISERLDKMEEGLGRSPKVARRGLFGLWR